MKTLTVVIPFYNEENTLKKSIIKVLDAGVGDEIILVNDCSLDKSQEIAEEFEKSYKNIKLLKTKKNSGKGGAIKHGISYIDSDLFVVHDADLEYNPEDLIEMKKLADENNDCVILGSRFIGNKKRNNIYKRALWANKFLSFLFSFINKKNVSDIATCYKLIPVKILKSIELTENGFGYDTEVLAKSLKNETKVIEVPIEYWGRTYEEGKKIGLSDGINFAYSIFKYRIR